MVTYCRPSVGGHLYEWDVRACKTNLLATLNRRPEPYHQKVLEHAERLRSGNGHDDSEVASIHDIVRFKQPNLDQKLAYDNWPRKSLVDHFLQPELTAETFRKADGILSAFSTAPYESSVQHNDADVVVELVCRGRVNTYEVTIRKTVSMSLQQPGELLVQYQLDDLPQDVPLHFASEFNFATMPGGASDRYFYGASGEQLSSLDSYVDIAQSTRLGLIDEWQGLDVSVEWTQSGGVWAFPIETISQSESGFELVHQSVAVVPHWNFVAPQEGPWVVDLRLTVNTSLAQARQLAKLGEKRRSTATESGVMESPH